MPCIATAVAAIPELIEAEATGLLVPPDDPGALAAAIGRLVADPAERARLGAAGMRRVRSRFPIEAGIAELAPRFGIDSRAQAAQ